MNGLSVQVFMKTIYKARTTTGRSPQIATLSVQMLDVVGVIMSRVQ